MQASEVTTSPHQSLLAILLDSGLVSGGRGNVHVQKQTFNGKRGSKQLSGVQSRVSGFYSGTRQFPTKFPTEVTATQKYGCRVVNTFSVSQ